MKNFIFVSALATLITFTTLNNPLGAQEAPSQPSQPDQQAQIKKSINHMLARAQLVRSLAAEHHLYILANREDQIIRLIEDASQVMAYNLICEDETMDNQALNDIATDVTFKIAVMAGKSTIAKQLEGISQQITMESRMELVGDMATTVLMFEVGRRRGLFDALLTDFGNKRFCAGLQADVRNRYNELISEME
ncbi:hypothetical protein [Kordiimonas laminariae]|uniref:hypothetical protein n=1 Tax=Kordiimonas laminariae TaxID=2917717 RepID=UPI001FF5F462|nr:hypothetical protein [Kordiimonas laminariae]MCK0068689.1 hypothetical protein [Kordiimonas laminariae]